MFSHATFSTLRWARTVLRAFALRAVDAQSTGSIARAGDELRERDQADHDCPRTQQAIPGKRTTETSARSLACERHRTRQNRHDAGRQDVERQVSGHPTQDEGALA